MDNKVQLKGKVKVEKSSEAKKFLSTFFSSSLKDAFTNTFTNVFVPYVKDMVCKIGTNTINFWVNGDKAGGTQQAGPNRISYWSGYANRNAYGGYSQPPVSRVSNSVYTMDNLCFDNRGDAEIVLEKLKEVLVTYKVASVADLYDMCGEKFNFTDYKYGWRNLDRASIARTNDGRYMLDLPKVVPLEN